MKITDTQKAMSMIALIAIFAALASSGCLSSAIQNYQVAEQYRVEREFLDAGMIPPIQRSHAEIIADNWWWKVPLAAVEIVGTGYLLHRALRDVDKSDAYHVEHHHYPAPLPVAE
jgi:hypothetical protein